jgi:Raf kinase inhibitor-like YbhB/YbcL family protein
MIKKIVWVGLLLGLSMNAQALRLTSTAFQPSQPIPTLYTCEGKDYSPPLSWMDVPAGTQSYVLTMDDPDAPAGLWTHWVLFNLPAKTLGLRENLRKLPQNAQWGANSWGHLAYNGPCPPTGSHHYVFTLYALDRVLALPAGSNQQQVLKALTPAVLTKVTLTGVYSKKNQ